MPHGLVHRLSWKFILHQTSRLERTYPDPSRRSVSLYLKAEFGVLGAIRRRCQLNDNASIANILQPMYSAFDMDVAEYGVEDLTGRHLLLSTALERHIDGVSSHEAMAWWFVFVFTHASGSWGRIRGVDYFDQWLEDADLDALENLVSIETHHWTETDVKACMDELEVAIRSREAMMNVILFNDGAR